MSDTTPAAAPAAAPAADPAAAAADPAAAAPAAPPLGRSDPAPGDAAPGGQVSDWMDALPDDLKADKTLALFKGKPVEDLAKGLIERQRMLGNRIELPKADDPDSFTRFAAAVRPENAEDYAIDVPEGQDSGFAELMRPVFHEAGLHPAQVERLVKANNAWVAAQQAELEQRGQAEVAELEESMGKAEFEASKMAANAWLTRMGIPVKFDTDLARLVGAGNSVRILFDIAKRTGELGKVADGDMALAMGTVTPEVARREAEAISRDPKQAAILNGPPSAEQTALKAKLGKYIKIIEAAQNH